MITLYVGPLGSGKSYAMAERALSAFRRGVRVYQVGQVTNFAKTVTQTEAQALVEDAHEEAVLLLDEAGLTFFSRDFARRSTEELAGFVTARKRHIRIFCTAQYIDQVDKVIRVLATELYGCLSFGRFRIVWPGFGFPLLRPFRCSVGFFRQEVFDAYDTYFLVSRDVPQNFEQAVDRGLLRVQQNLFQRFATLESYRKRYLDG